jgi:hypothetical protein
MDGMINGKRASPSAPPSSQSHYYNYWGSLF